MRLFPVHLRLEGKPALVIGGGRAAAGRSRALFEAGAAVRIVAREVSPELERVLTECGGACERRAFVRADLDGAWIVVAATDDPELHREIHSLCEARRILVCSVDDPDRSNWIAPAVLRRGELVVTVSTSGAAPALAARLRDRLGEVVGEQYGAVLARLREVRLELRARYPKFEDRRAAWRRLLDEQVLPALERGELPEIGLAEVSPR